MLFLGLPSCKPLKESRGNSTEFQNTNLYGSDFGLGEKELSLTFDDGPSTHSLKLAEFLRDEGISATFFMTSAAALANKSTTAAIAALKFPNGSFAHQVANHSVTHPMLKTGNAVSEIRDANAALEKFVTGTFFFRPPYGYFQQNKSSARDMREDPTSGNDIAGELNATSLKKYVGPVYWDIGGHLEGKYGADWACWSLVDVQYILPDRKTPLTPAECGARYEKEAVDVGRGIILAHDIHAKTVEMIMGSEAFSGLSGTPSLVKQLKAKGFKFVRLGANANALKQWTEARAAESFPGTVSFSYNSVKSERGFEVSFSAASPQADRLDFRINEYKGRDYTNADGAVAVMALSAEQKYAATYNAVFTDAGIRFVTLSSYKGGKLFARKTFMFKIGG
jgi:peptidoglycan/xylan/chitin deacetylase (PgdA/CDA1 family)